MDKIIQFTPKQNKDAQRNLTEFISQCKSELTVFGSDLEWEENYWPTANIYFGNLDKKSRLLDSKDVMQKPFLGFAKAYLRYQQGHNPTRVKQEMPALKCLEKALISFHNRADISDLNIAILDVAATIARDHLSSGVAYHAGRELARLASFVSEKKLIPGWLDWKSPNKRPIDSVRTGKKAQQLREKKLPNEDALNAIADIFSSNPTSAKDIFTSSVCALLLCAPSRVSEILCLPVDCEVWETKRDGKKAYGWRFQPGKGGLPYIKWIPESMETIAQEAIKRVRNLSTEARTIAKWYEENPMLCYPTKSEENSFKLPKDFPWFDKKRNLKYSEALFCFQAKQLRTDMPASSINIWKPSANTVNDDLASVEKKKSYFAPSIFDRNGFNKGHDVPLKMTSHQFRHLLNTMAQRGGLSQSEIARWSGRADMKQNRVYDHMTEFELVDIIRSHDSSLSLDQSLTELAEQISAKIPMTKQEFNTLAMPTAHVTEYGFCIHDFTMSPCQHFRDCLNCTEQVCIKGDRRLARIKERYFQVKRLKEQAEQEIKEGTAGADRWYEIHHLTEMRLKELIEILENPEIKDGTIVKLRNKNEFSPIRRAVETRLNNTNTNELKDRNPLEEMRALLGGGLG